ncbi:aminoacylase-1 isoform X2 [Prunus yedoensis var. nudiflora]|uniref:Aminoacylase-1 isoform X2 n=1 Tax=Prunus yedoensis var. nudiflora TaxID=2094558 RepID=A0A314YSY3_PRUYE|nr:aminoacylase-1 isoform X2 [Prunus yedoensis var. nudiflora]
MELSFHLCIISLLLLSSKSAAKESEIISRFQRYLQINTAQPEPLYREAADFILSEAASLSLESQTLEFVPGKPLVLLKWPGSDPSLSSVLLNSHTDGSQDMKCVGIQYLEAIRRLKASGFEPKRSVYLSFVPDEEIGGHAGAEKFAESDVFKGLNVGLVLDEGLASPTENYRTFYAERCPMWLVIKATGAPGHGAKLYDNTAMENLLKSI